MQHSMSNSLGQMNTTEFDESVIVVYQMGKVGSSSIYDSLKNADLSAPIYKVHALSNKGLERGIEFHHHVLKRPWDTDKHSRISTLLREKLSGSRNIQWRIITLVREPISREISEFFQYVDSLYPNILDGNGHLSKERATRALQAKFMFFDQSTNYACRWFDMEIKQVFDVDVYSHPFSYCDGFTIINHKNVSVLVFRLEDLDRCFNRGLTTLLHLESPIEMIRSNLRVDQEHGDIYGEVMRDIAIPRSVCSRVYSSRYATHFYDGDEIERLIKKWSRK